MAQQLGSTQNKGNNMRRPHRLTLLLVSALAAIIFGLALAPAGRARAATGDNLRNFAAAVPECASGTGTGMAFDGARIYLSCWFSNVLERVSPADGSSLGPITIAGTSDLGALSYDRTRGKIWACSGGSDVLLINLSTNTASLQFTSNGCADGLAYDTSDGTLWASCQTCNVVYHYTTTGSVIGPASGYDVSTKLGGFGNTGIVALKDKLYLGNDGGQQIYACSKDLVTCTLNVTSPNGVDDMECDSKTFAPKTAIWSQNAFSRTLNAWEVPAASCNPPPCPADVNDDGVVNFADVLLVARHAGVRRYDGRDIQVVLTHFGKDCSGNRHPGRGGGDGGDGGDDDRRS
jgi:hypothetical protein